MGMGVSNVIDRRTNEPIGGARPYLIKTFGTLKVGFIGLCLSTTEISKADLTHTEIVDPLVSAGRYIPILERQGVQAIVAITQIARPLSLNCSTGRGNPICRRLLSHPCPGVG